ncbi:AAA family ATPase [Candidatus Woesearchaeota archaeon]|nr:AAA family ATPase [Candidatus Woesearchaeota archaeon]
MTHFGNILGSEESLFRNEVALDYSFIPKLIPYREMQQRLIAAAIKPLFNERNGKNLLLHGLPGVGKTVACKHVVNEIEEHTEDIYLIYVNCWQRKTTYQIALEICDVLGYKFTQNKKTEELMDMVKQLLNKKQAVFVLDEVDKLEDVDLIYYLLEEIYRKSIILITNYKDWIGDLDNRIKSRLTAELLEFKPYNLVETKGILKHRMDYAFVSGVWGDEAFEDVVNKTFGQKDIRQGLYLMREAGNAAEERASRKIEKKDVEEAIKKLEEFNIKNPEELEDDTQFILDVIKKNSGEKIGDIFKRYQEEGGKRSYKSFTRKIKLLEQGKFIAAEKITGAMGNTTILKYKEKEKKLTEF